jgi:hypothetical protein
VTDSKIVLEELPSKFISFRSRWEQRNIRMQIIQEAVNGNWSIDGPDDDSIENRSPNMIQIALEDTAEASSILPTIRVHPSDGASKSKEDAYAMERMGMSYMDVSKDELLSLRSFLDLGAYGMFSWVIHHDQELGGPLIEWRDPRTCYPEPGWKTMDSVRECFFARELYVNQLPAEWREKVYARWPDGRKTDQADNRSVYMQGKKVILVEYFTEQEWLIGVFYQSGTGWMGGSITYEPVEIARGMNPGGICPVVIGQRMTLDNEPRGQFDQVVGLMKAHIRLMGLVLDYADQAVYSDVWVKDLIGPLNFGGGSYIQLGPNGGIGRVAPAQTDMSVFQELSSLIDSMHLGGRWPKSRPGEIDQAIASAKFLESTVGIMNTVIKTNHMIMARAKEQALRLAFLADKTYGSDTRPVSGVLRNQQFAFERKKDQIDLKARVRVEYGLGLGRDPAQAMVLGIQMSQAGFVSNEYVQENFEGITDVGLERSRIDVEQMQKMAMAQLLEGLQNGTVPKSALIKIAKARQDGEDIFELFEEYIIKPQEEAAAQMPMSGLTGGPVAPGAPAPAGAGMPAPQAPPPQDLLAALAGGGAGPQGPESMSRLNTPIGNGGFAGTTAQIGPGR